MPTTTKPLAKFKWASLRAQGGPFVYRIELGAFPLRQPAREAWAALAEAIMTKLHPPNTPEWEVFAQFNAMHLDPAKEELSRRGPRWLPSLALGLFPDGAPPALYTEDELLAMDPKDSPRPLCHQLFQIGGDPVARAEAVAVFAGSGALAAMLPRFKTSLAAYSEVLGATIKEETFRHFPLNVPLFGQSTAENAGKTPLLDEALKAVSAAIAEDHMKGEACVVSTQPIEAVLEQAAASGAN